MVMSGYTSSRVYCRSAICWLPSVDESVHNIHHSLPVLVKAHVKSSAEARAVLLTYHQRLAHSKHQNAMYAQ